VTALSTSAASAVVNRALNLADDTRTRPDLRLAVPAGAAWSGTFVSTSAWWPNIWLAAFLCPALILLATGFWRQRRLAVVAACLGLAAGLGMGSVRVAALHNGLVDDLAREGAAARLTLVVTADPLRHAGTTAGSARRGSDTVIVSARVVALTARGRDVIARLPILVLALDREPSRRWQRLLPGQRVRTSGVLRAARPGQPLAAVVLARSPPELVGRPPLVQRAAGELRAGLRGAAADLPAGPRGLLPGLVLGDTSRMPPHLVDDFRTAGLTHLNAVSGL
jgi:competence protein ComEC